MFVATMAFSVAVLGQSPAATLQDVWAVETDLKFDDLFPRRSFMGKSASVQGYSHDDRYIAYLWSPYEDRGLDIYLFDTKTRASKRLTNMDFFRPFDREIRRAAERYKQDDERLKRWDTLSDAEWRQERQKLREENEKRTTPLPVYPGVSQVSWANKSHEMLFTYRGDIYRWKVGEERPTRLTMTRDQESQISYLPDDSGMVFRRGNDVYRMDFKSPFVMQINPQLPAGTVMSGYSVSPKGDKMLVFGFRDRPGERQVDYIVYRDRFAQALKTNRQVSDDPFLDESVIYLFDIRPEVLSNMEEDISAFEVAKWGGTDSWEEIMVHSDPWSPDGRNFVFGTWHRGRKDLKLREAVLEFKRVRTVWEGTSTGEHTSASYLDPFYTKDGQNIVATLEKSGFRHAHIIERIGGKERQVTSGNFELYPVANSQTDGHVLAWTTMGNPARRQIVRVNLQNGNITPLQKQEGNYSTPSFANKSDAFTSTFESWSTMRELTFNDGQREVALTDSHRKNAQGQNALLATLKLKPELFTYTNRHGDTVHGYLFLPPGFKKTDQRPLMVYTYGGPLGSGGNSVTDGSFNSTAFMFAQYLSYTLGYVTATIDPRGSSGYGARFGAASFNNAGVPQTEDLVDGAKHLIANYGVDPKKVGLNGWSFGGFQTQHTMYTQPGVYTLGIAGAGPTEWQNYNNWYVNGVIGQARRGRGVEDLDKFSLTNVAKNLQDPLLLLHGVEDTNVLYQDTMMVYRRLLQAGKGPLVELAVDPTGGHGMGGDMDNRDRHLIYLAFLVKWWGIPSYARERHAEWQAAQPAQVAVGGSRR